MKDSTYVVLLTSPLDIMKYQTFYAARPRWGVGVGAQEEVLILKKYFMCKNDLFRSNPTIWNDNYTIYIFISVKLYKINSKKIALITFFSFLS